MLTLVYFFKIRAEIFSKTSFENVLGIFHKWNKRISTYSPCCFDKLSQYYFKFLNLYTCLISFQNKRVDKLVLNYLLSAAILNSVEVIKI